MSRKLSFVGSFVLLAALALLFPSRIAAQNYDPDHNLKFSDDSLAASRAREERIRLELQGLKGHPWAGEYHYGDGLGVIVDLILAPKSGFVFTWNGCLGLYDLNYGDVEEHDGKIELKLTFPNDREGFHGIAPELVPVLWGNRHYLIPSDGMIEFSNDVNSGFEPCPGEFLCARYLLRHGDDHKRVHGKPGIPTEYLPYLLNHPIEAAISSIKETHLNGSNRITTVVLSSGSAKGVKREMEFHVYRPARKFESARVTKVEPTFAEAEIEEFEPSPDSKPPSIGWKLSTNAFHK
ncbi:MAG: hypothetical protein WB995_13225 [Candidatus Acidiferrales bacterium]